MRFCEILTELPPRSAGVHPRITVINRAAVGPALVSDLTSPSPVDGHWQAIVEIEGRMIDLASVWRAGYAPSVLVLASDDLPDMSGPVVAEDAAPAAKVQAVAVPVEAPPTPDLSVADAIKLATATPTPATSPVATSRRPGEDRSGRAARARAAACTSAAST